MSALGEIPLEHRKLVEMIVQAFYPPEYFVLATNLLDMGEKGATEEKLAQRVKLSAKTVRKFMAKLREDGVVHGRSVKNAEEEEAEKNSLSHIALEKLHPSLRNQQRFVSNKRGEYIWFYKFDHLTKVIMYRWTKMTEQMARSQTHIDEWRCPNPSCISKGKIYRVDVLRLRAKDGYFRCPEESCREGTSNEGSSLGTRLVLTDQSKQKDAQKLDDLKKRFNVRMKPILDSMRRVDTMLSRAEAAHFALAYEDEDDEDISKTDYGKR
eukprot:CAMPEP_0197525498 /NCGR_PEP_ID=MMETSP1318-20131121/12837_1 /TAXON_ID=552666 /ORGANISM="Partenskyella glossopodia, Strain RCC365" /LENGTH=266 /DNA_ID=CAMNT_0043079007 /DNA_START=39 /DNA_END=835 /DNA_ORIENTATION=-